MGIKKTKKIIVGTIFFLLLTVGSFSFFLPEAAAQTLGGDTADKIGDQTDAFRDTADYDSGVSVGGVIAVVIKAALGFMGIVFLTIIIINGFRWMTAGGNEEQVKKSQQAISRAIIGLIIVAASYAITYFVFDVLAGIEGGGGPGGGPVF